MSRILICCPMGDRGVNEISVTNAETVAIAKLFESIGHTAKIASHHKHCKTELGQKYAFDQTQWQRADQEFDILVHLCSVMNWYGGYYRISSTQKLAAEHRMIAAGKPKFNLIIDPALPREPLYSNFKNYETTRQYEKGAVELTEQQWYDLTYSPSITLFAGDYNRYISLLKVTKNTKLELQNPSKKSIYFPIYHYLFRNKSPQVFIRGPYEFDLAYAGFYRKDRAKLMKSIFEGTTELRKALIGIQSRFKTARSKWSDKSLENAWATPPLPLKEVELCYQKSVAGLLLGDPAHNSMSPLHREMQLLSLSIPIISYGLDISSQYLTFQDTKEIAAIIDRLKNDHSFQLSVLEKQKAIWDAYYREDYLTKFADEFNKAIECSP